MEDINVLREFKNDEVYKQFLTDDFDVKVVTSSAVQCVAVTEHLAKLSTGISLLDKELHHQVANHYEDLLSQATEIETLEGVLQMVHSRIQTLIASTDRLIIKVVEPYEDASNQTNMLVRLQNTCNLLRRIIRIFHLCRRLETQLQGKAGEIIKAAQCLNELDYLMEGSDLSGLDIIYNDLQFIKRAQEQVDSQAKTLLQKGIETQNQSNVATALQVFYYLKILLPTVHQIVHQTKDKVCQSIQQVLDVRFLSQQSQDAVYKINAPGRAAMPMTGNASAFRAKLWANMESLMNEICTACNEIQHLQKVLVKKRDPISHIRFLDVLTTHGEFNVVQSFWEAITKQLTEEFSKAADESTFIKQAFEVEFPKLLCMFNDLIKKLQEFSNDLSVNDAESPLSVVTGTETGIFLGSTKMELCPEKSLRHALAPFESAYLSRCLTRLTDSVNVVYAGEAQVAPTIGDIEGILKAINSELSAASIDPLLLENVARNVADTINFVVEKCQFLVNIDPDAIQVINVPNPSQLLNARVVHLLHLLQTMVLKSLCCNYFTIEAHTIIEKSLQSAVSLMTIVIEPLLQSVASAIEAIIGTIHSEDFSLSTIDNNGKSLEGTCSLYMKELQHFIGRAQHDYFALYPDCEVVIKGIQQLASRSIELFVRHASLVRPLGDGGKMRLAADCAQMEMAVAPLCQRIGDLGKSYRLLRSFRPLLFQTPNHIALSPAVGDIIPYSIALQFLFAKAPQELRSPHEIAAWSINKYSHWLDSHLSEKERLTLIKGTLEAYVKHVNQRQDKEFCSVYPVMADLLQKGMQTFNGA